MRVLAHRTFLQRYHHNNFFHSYLFVFCFCCTLSYSIGVKTVFLVFFSVLKLFQFLRRMIRQNKKILLLFWEFFVSNDSLTGQRNLNLGFKIQGKLVKRSVSQDFLPPFFSFQNFRFCTVNPLFMLQSFSFMVNVFTPERISPDCSFKSI